MSLVSCKACSAPVDSLARSCPQCGASWPGGCGPCLKACAQYVGCVVVVVIILVILIQFFL